MAAADHDFVLTEPVSKLKHLREKLLTARRHGSRRTGRRSRRYLSVLVAGFFGATAGAILLNALAWQTARHPAPLFARATPAAAAKEPTIAGMSAVPAPRPQPAVAPIQAHDKPVEKPPLEMPAGRASATNPRQFFAAARRNFTLAGGAACAACSAQPRRPPRRPRGPRPANWCWRRSARSLNWVLF